MLVIICHVFWNLIDIVSPPKLTVAASQIAFGYGGASTTIKSYGVPKGGSKSYQGSASAGMLNIFAVFLIFC